MPSTTKTATASESLEIAAPCRACIFGRGADRACVLLEAGDSSTLFSEGPCDLPEMIRAGALELIRRRYPFARSIDEDIASEVLLQVMEAENLLMPGQIKHLTVLQRRIRGAIKNAVIDSLRHHKLIVRLKCSACVQFAMDPPPEGCHLRDLPSLGTENAPNPWYGKVERTTDPRKLQPPCTAFSWRRPETHDIFEEEIPGIDAQGTPRERAVHLLVRAIDHVSRQDNDGLRCAAVLFWHYLKGKEVKALAEEVKVSEKTVKRLLASGRERLAEVLEREFGITSAEEIL